MIDVKFDNQPIMFAVAESELQRFRKIETENTLLKAQIEKMKCCENCKHRYYENGINYCNNRCQEKLYNNWELKG